MTVQTFNQPIRYKSEMAITKIALISIVAITTASPTKNYATATAKTTLDVEWNTHQKTTR